jgi:copper chaperone
MEKMKFKTTIKCMGCVAQVTPYLDEMVGKENWNVDTASPDKTLTISTPAPVTSAQIISTLQEVGYKATEQ